ATQTESYATPISELQQALDELQAARQAWAELPIKERIQLLDEIKGGTHSAENRWVAAGMQAKGTRPETVGEGEEWFTLSVVYRYIRYLRKTLVDIEKRGTPILPGKLCWKRAGLWQADLLPANWHDRLALLGVRAEAWVTDTYKGDAPPMASFYRQEEPVGKVALVLAAGNLPSLVVNDALHKLFVEGQVVLLKTNPVNAYISAVLTGAFKALIERDFIRIVHGGGEIGAQLSQDPRVDEVHLTGSERTFNAVTYGSGFEGEERRRQKQPILHKRFTAELGNISPVIIVPGTWSKRDILKQAQKIGSWLVPNAGFNCVTPRVLIQMKDWKYRDKLNKEIACYLDSLETRKAYYPHAKSLYQEFSDQHPEARQLGSPAENHLPWTFIPDLDSEKPDEICFNTEAFLSLFAETGIAASGTIDFIERAVQFANERLRGSLCVSIIVHPKSMKDPAIAAAVDKAIADLRYGSVVINHWGALAYYAAMAPWGAYPGHPHHDIHSGVGKVHNPLMLDAAEKSVFYAPFISFPDPYMAHAKKNYRYFRQDTRYQHTPSTINLVKLLWYALTS
ncbi:MAG: aldehyde dehydrogenase family protein, partial [Anaerolineales bacterium]